MKIEKETAGSDEKFEQAVNLLLNIRLEAKKNKDFGTSNKIRDELNKIGIIVKDKKDGFEWEIK